MGASWKSPTDVPKRVPTLCGTTYTISITSYWRSDAIHVKQENLIIFNSSPLTKDCYQDIAVEPISDYGHQTPRFMCLLKGAKTLNRLMQFQDVVRLNKMLRSLCHCHTLSGISIYKGKSFWSKFKRATNILKYIQMCERCTVSANIDCYWCACGVDRKAKG